MRRFAIAFALCLAAPASAATDDGSLACRLVDKPMIERLSGQSIRSLVPQAMNMCAGVCPSLNASLCIVSLAADRPDENTWTVWVYQPPFEDGDWASMSGDSAIFGNVVHEEMIEWVGARAVWNYRRDQRRGFLTVWTNDHGVLVIVTQERGAINEGASLSNAKAIAARALMLFRNQR